MIDPKRKTDELIAFIRQSFEEAGFEKAVIGLSGGVDSSTSCVLTARALGKEDVYPVLLPYGDLSVQGVAGAQKVIALLGIAQESVAIIDIKPMVDAFVSLDPTMDNIRKGNIMARTRMICLFDQAKKRKALVVGTENKSEHLLGYFTRFGDEASDIEPLRSLYKTQVYKLAKYLGIPQEIIDKEPTAGLWEGQTDEGEFGFTYQEADEILYLLYDKKLALKEITQSGYAEKLVEKVQRWVEKNSFKHHLPLVLI